MVSSSVYPSLERKLGGPDNWVEQVGGLPKYIERIAKHLHYEKGYSISRSIAIAVNTVKRWARKGGVVKYGDPKNRHVTTITAAQAAAAVAEWEAKKAMARALPGTPRGGRMGGKRSIGLAEETLGISALAERANAIADPRRKAEARARILELAAFSTSQRKRLASAGAAMPDGSFPIRNAADLRNACRAIGRSKNPAAAKRHIMQRARALGLTSQLPASWRTVSMSFVLELAAMTKDGRRSFKGVGKHKPPYQWKHGFKPVTKAAVVSKAKGSPIAERRITRLYGPGQAVGNTQPTPSGPRSVANRPGAGKVRAVQAGGRGTTTAATASQLRNVKVAKAAKARPDQKIITDKSTGGAGRAGRSALAAKAWDQIPDKLRVIRNGKRYVLSSFGGKMQLVEWHGPGGGDVAAPNTNIRVSVDSRTANALSKSELRKALRTRGKARGKAARAPLNAALQAKLKAGKR